MFTTVVAAATVGDAAAEAAGVELITAWGVPPSATGEPVAAGVTLPPGPDVAGAVTVTMGTLPGERVGVPPAGVPAAVVAFGGRVPVVAVTGGVPRTGVAGIVTTAVAVTTLVATTVGRTTGVAGRMVGAIYAGAGR